MLYYIQLENGSRMCQDFRFRHFTHFGTFPECMKFYKRPKWAERKADLYDAKVIGFDPKKYTVTSEGVLTKID